MRKPKPAPRGGLIAALDVGTTKICCFIARTGDNGQPQVTGIGHQVAHGVRGGTIVDNCVKPAARCLCPSCADTPGALCVTDAQRAALCAGPNAAAFRCN